MKRKNRSHLNNKSKKKMNNLNSPLETNYHSFSFLNEVYKIDEIVAFTKKTNVRIEFGKIKSIYCKESNPPQFFVNLIKFYCKEDLSKELEKKYPFITDLELFAPIKEEVVTIEVQCIKNKVKVSLNVYDEAVNLLRGKTMFQRAKVDVKRNIFDPKVENWVNFCSCKQPYNPISPYILCEKCSKWYHTECYNLKQENIEDLTFFCMECEKTRKRNKK